MFFLGKSFVCFALRNGSGAAGTLKWVHNVKTLPCSGFKTVPTGRETSEATNFAL